MKNGLIIFFFLLCFSRGKATHLEITNPTLYFENGKAYAVLNITWDNAWHNDKNHDAVWLFFKLLHKNGGYDHLKVADSEHEVVNLNPEVKSGLQVEMASDSVGVFVYPKESFRGMVSATLKIALNENSFKKLKLENYLFHTYGIEMVYIPKGGFTLGHSGEAALKYGSFYASDEKGEPAGLYQIKNEDQVIEIGQEEGNLCYRTDNYKGDQKGLITKEFPKGVDPFYIMKYELTQGQYVQFLNTLHDQQSQHRANFGGKNYYKNRGSIFIENGIYKAKEPSAHCNYLSWDDAMAFADWAGLRPMTEFEFTKASRGPAKPKENDFPWGTIEKIQVQRAISLQGVPYILPPWKESQLTDITKPIFGASYYWVMDLAGSLWERVITVGDEKGRAFTGSNGDGKITWYGFANQKDWPSGIVEEGGFGFRGGGFYIHGRHYHEFNPYSPVGYRPYGAWSGGNRTEAYGSRFVRSH